MNAFTTTPNCNLKLSLFSQSGLLEHINPFSTNVPLLYPLKTSENRRFSNVFRGYRSGTLVENGLSEPLFRAAGYGKREKCYTA